MKYKIIIEKIDENQYLAFCPVLDSVRSTGASVTEALEGLHRELLLCLHDPAPEFEIEGNGNARSARPHWTVHSQG